MTEINRYYSGELSSTRLMQEAMEESHSVEAGEGKKLDWHADHQTLTAGQQEEHDAPIETVHAVAVWAANKAGVANKEQIEKKIEHVVQKKAQELIEEKVKETFNLPLKDAQWEAIKSEASRVAMDALPEVALAAAGIAAVVAAAAEAVHAFNKGDELKHLKDLDAMDVATTAVLDLDPGFKAADMAKHVVALPGKVVAYINTSPFGAHKPELQAAADAGARLGLDALRHGGRAAYERMHPEVAKRLHNDIAFNKGFESVMWAASQPDAAAHLHAIKAGLHDRDPRTSAHHIIQG